MRGPSISRGCVRTGCVLVLVGAAALVSGCALSWQLTMRSGAQSLYLGNDEGAFEHFSRALAIAEQGGGDDPRIAPSLEALGAVHYRRARADRAEPLVRRALALREEQDGPRHAELVYPLLGLYHVAVLDPARSEEAEGYLARLESIASATAEYEPKWKERRLLMALVITEAAHARFEQERYAAAEPLYLNALNRFERLGRHTYGFELPAIEDFAELLTRTDRNDEVAALHARFDHTSDEAEDYLRLATAYQRWAGPRRARWSRARMPLRVHLPRPDDALCSDPDSVLEAVRGGIVAWSDVVEPGLPSFEFVEARGQADVPILWEARQAHGAIGRARIRPLRGDRLAVDWIRLALRYDDGTEAPLDFLRLTAMHEMGHALGLIGHSPYPTDIMCERARGCLVGRIHGLTDRDRATLQRLYGRR